VAIPQEFKGPDTLISYWLSSKLGLQCIRNALVLVSVSQTWLLCLQMLYICFVSEFLQAVLTVEK